jgi:hypothetical protein
MIKASPPLPFFDYGLGSAIVLDQRFLLDNLR